MKFILLDTETTGIEISDRIIQLAYIVLENGKKPIVYNELFSSDIVISFESMSVHNITPEMLEGKSSCVSSEAYNYLNEINSSENYLVIQNKKFDLDMLSKEGFVSKFKEIDTLQCIKHLDKSSKKYGLQYLRYSLGLYKSEAEDLLKLGLNEIKAHDALGDVFVLKQLLTYIKKLAVKEYGDEWLDMLVELTNKKVLVNRMPFGKHKDKLLTDIYSIDSSYFDWLLKSSELDENLRYSLESVMGTKDSKEDKKTKDEGLL